MSSIDYLFISGAVASAIIYWHKNKKPAPSLQKPKTASAIETLVSRPGNQLPILLAEELYKTSKSHGYVERIRTTLGFLPENFAKDVKPLLDSFAQFVQLLPASQSHHHAQPGGLLEHTLEVASYALTLRQGYKLPPDSSVEEQIKLGVLWSYAILVAALLHDIGKPVSDVEVTLYGKDPGHIVGRWNAIAGSMPDLQKNNASAFYSVDFPDQTDYSAHQNLAMSLLHAMVPPSGLSWLGTDTLLMQQLVAYLQKSNGYEKGVIHEIITKADSTSVENNLKNGSRTRFTTAKIQPLIERLNFALRQVVLGGNLPANRPGAALFLDPDGEHIYIVAGIAGDKTRHYLEQEAIQNKQSAKVPLDNSRLFDAWQEYGFCVTPGKEHGKGAIWWVQIEQDDWSKVLTCIKFKADFIYQNNTKPGLFSGTITPVSPSTSRDKTAPVEPTINEELAGNIAQSNALAEPAFELEHSSPETVTELTDATESPNPTPFWAEPAMNSTAEPEPEPESHLTTEPASFNSKAEPAEVISSTSSKTAPASDSFLGEADTVSTPKPQVQKIQAYSKVIKPPMRKAGASARLNADAFMAWVQKGLGTNEVIYNESEAFVHFVNDGMAIISPKGFKEYLLTNKYIGSIGNSKDEVRALQREMQKSGYLVFNKAANSHFHQYQTLSGDGKTGAVITCYLVPNPQAYISPVPSPNPLLQKVESVKTEPTNEDINDE